jgi:hypothetical protein
MGSPGLDPKQEAGDEAGEAKSRRDAQDYSGNGQLHAMPDDKFKRPLTRSSKSILKSRGEGQEPAIAWPNRFGFARD